MTCRRGHPVPDGAVICPACANAVTREYQIEPLRHLNRSNGYLTTRLIDGTRHVQMFGGTMQCFCGAVSTTAHRRDLARFHELPTVICATCVKAIHELIAENTQQCSA